MGGTNNFKIFIIKQFSGARTDIRENSGRLAIDMLKPTASEDSRRTYSVECMAIIVVVQVC